MCESFLSLCLNIGTLCHSKSLILWSMTISEALQWLNHFRKKFVTGPVSCLRRLKKLSLNLIIGIYSPVSTWGRRELILARWPLISTYMTWHVCTNTHTPTVIHTQRSNCSEELKRLPLPTVAESSSNLCEHAPRVRKQLSRYMIRSK